MSSNFSKQPLVSIIMPTYNYAQFIGDAVKSVINQTYKNWELIIIDNYSEDNTEEIVDSFDDPRIIYIKFRNNGIIAASRNQGIRDSRGTYISFLDSDDMWLPEKLEKQVYFLNQHSDYFLVYTQSFKKTNDKDAYIIFPQEKELKKGEIFKELFVSNNFILTLTVLMRKGKSNSLYLFDEDRNLVAIEDYVLWLKIAKNEKVGFINEPLAVYRVHGSNFSNGVMPYLKRNMKAIHMFREDVNKFSILKKILYLLAYTLTYSVIK